jgi:hypothetical protein
MLSMAHKRMSHISDVGLDKTDNEQEENAPKWTAGRAV